MESQTKKKILYVITKSNWGGAQKYVFDLATSIDKERFEIVVLLGGNGELKERLTEKEIRVISLNELGRDISIFKDFSAFKKLITIFKKEKPNIIHINSSKIGGLGALAGRITKVPMIVFTAHGWAWNEDRNWWQKKIIKELQWLTMLLSHKTIAVSDALVRQVSSFAFVTKKIVRIYTGIHTPRFLTKDEARHFFIQKSAVLKSSAVWIVTVAELHKNKGHSHTLKSLKILMEQGFFKKNNVQFIFVGEGEEKNNLQNICRELGLENQVIFLGKIPDVALYLKAFDLFVLTSNTEALGYVLIEAGLAQIPVIGSVVGGIPEVIEDMKTGILVHRKNPKEIAHAIEYFLEHKDKQKEFSDALYEKVKNIFSIEKMIQKTEKIYLENTF